MAQATDGQPGTDGFVREVIQQYRTKLLDLTSRNPLISFRHSERSRSHIRVVDEIPEKLFGKLDAGKQLFFDPLPDPEPAPSDELTPMFQTLLRRAKGEDQAYKEALNELGPNPSPRQKQKVERELRNRVRSKLGLPPFQPTWDPAQRAKELGINPDYELPVLNGQTARRYNDSKIQVLFFAEDLERKLSALRDAARVLEKDAGYNALYCAFGFLEYYESDQSDQKRVAPLVFVPVTLDRQLVEHRYVYFIQTRNEDIQVNVALAELLKQMAVTLPAWVEDEKEEDPLGAYLRQVEKAIAAKRDWKVRRYITIGLFTFSTLAMYNDLDPQRWPPEKPLEERPVVRTLIAGAEVSNVQYADDYEIDVLQGPEPLLITDADSSQHSAVVDVLRSKSSQVIQGPPGTGKSQTITNIVAAALNEGLNVLFVAEKMAALEVVKKRLDDTGLRVFCLELHSSKTSKAAVADALAQRLEYHAPRLRPDQVASNAEALTKARTELLHYVRCVNNDAGRTGLKVYDVLLGSAVRDELRRDLPDDIAQARFANPLNIDTYLYRQMSDAAATLEAQMHALTAFGKLSEHPWRGFQNIEITELDETRLVSLMMKWNHAISLVIDDAKAIESRACVALPPTQHEIELLCKKLVAIPSPPTQAFATETYRRCSSKHNRDRVRSMLEQISKLIASEAALEACCADIAAARSIGSKAMAASVTALRELGLERFTVASILDLKKEAQRVADLVANLSGFCDALVQSVGLKQASIDTLRASAAAVELLGRLPRALWNKRLPAIIDETNRPVLERGAAQVSALKRRHDALATKFDLQLLPRAEELRTHGLALRSANPVTALFGSTCRQARRVFRGIARDSSKKPRRTEMANGLLECAQYLTDVDTFASSKTLGEVCGALFAGLDTPLPELLAVSNWATDVRQRLAAFGDAGIPIQNFLFTAVPAQLDRLLAARDQSGFSALTGVLDNTSAGDNASWSEIVEWERTRARIVREASDLFVAARFRLSCNEAQLADGVQSLEAAETATSRLAEDSVGLEDVSSIDELDSCRTQGADSKALMSVPSQRSQFMKHAVELAGGSVPRLREGRASVEAALKFADSIASLDLPSEFLRHFFEDPENITAVRASATELLRKCSVMGSCIASVNEVAQLDPGTWCGAESFQDAQLRRLLERNQYALKHIGALRDYISFLLAEDAACDLGIGPVLSVYSAAGEDYRNLQRAVEFVFYRSAAEAILNNDPRLRRHSGATHQELRNQFRALDREYLDLKRKELALKLLQRQLPSGNSHGPVAELTELALVTRVAGQTRPRIMVRDLINRAGKAMQALMPCWMMSPMSVAQYLDPRNLHFDLVIMDEASQIRPAEALGAIARGAKAVIVGDQMQLPPTPFFQRLSAGEASEDDEFAEDTRQDSVLEAAAGRFYPSRRLKWHYRSEHDSLIAFSNHEFYQNDLTVFPSPFYDHPDYGVALVQTNGIYKAGLNEIEGKAVVKAAIEFMQKHPTQSLGLVAVNAKQAEFIREQLDREIASDPDAAAYAQAWNGKLEEYFVKNLENVQGDERDVIFISTVYGKDENGNFYQRFGPINGIYGHRRLNVLFTRAKKKVTVFTSMTPEDIQDGGKHPGVGVLKRYLQYARDGISVVSTPTGAECDSEFERWVLQVLQAHGYHGVPQVGVCGYRIDIGVQHPAKPGVFLCGIECDGATYHSARSVRERDRLRQEILERRNWKLYRIWSTDWFRNPSLQTKQLLRFLEQLHPPTTQA
jgi:very-short-patch-repair endonuclease/KaiC/GvpD/RAD55 family RecA-like ATPase